ncbi:hypothetical protein F2P45_21425 [Massilia sp. CCM 8733]|uniref:Uncharacterized protein n=1 Tax=Massilia mucilaginosa TaxID=2609282 RepID=A0ABX0NXF0_9BURK|nr:hypothetical protein [Massilia mucilaginosa]NHZ91547.1 hypothetical protein [Massilia mucilaginosa]
MRSGELMMVALLACSVPASACDAPLITIADYVHGAENGRLVFVGSVGSPVSQKAGGVVIEDVTVRVRRVFGKSNLPPTLPVLNRITGGMNPCGTRDFSASAGDQWLIFGQRDAGRVYPDLQLSRKLVNGHIDQSLLRQITPSLPSGK